MHLNRPSAVRALIERLDFRPSRALGQNFLVDGNLRDLIIDTADPAPGDTVVEVGPGLGVLTGALLDRCGRLVAVEKDERLAAHLRETFGDDPRLELHHTDAVHFDFAGVGCDRFVSNLPYSVGSRILFDLFRDTVCPPRIVATVQREVADRLVAEPGGKTYGLLSVMGQTRYAIKRVRNLAPTCFWPPPQIDSSLLLFERLETPQWPVRDWNRWRALVKRGFTHRRKTLRRILRDAGWTTDTDLDLGRRPETLTVEEWGRLADSLAAPGTAG